MLFLPIYRPANLLFCLSGQDLGEIDKRDQFRRSWFSSYSVFLVKFAPFGIAAPLMDIISLFLTFLLLISLILNSCSVFAQFHNLQESCIIICFQLFQPILEFLLDYYKIKCSICNDLYSFKTFLMLIVTMDFSEYILLKGSIVFLSQSCRNFNLNAERRSL